MTCEYYGASLDWSLPNNGLPLNEQPVNLDWCETMKKNYVPQTRHYHIIFYFRNTELVIWEFINEPLRDLEWNRALDLIKEKSEQVL